jgi:hypothetical protein
LNDLELLRDLAHYAVFANAAYGWKLDLALNGKVSRGDLQTLLKKTGIDPEHVVTFESSARTHRPAFFIVRDVSRKKIVLAIRGTLSTRDVLTDLCCTAEDFETGGRGLHRAHHGMLESARGIAEVAEEVVKQELEENPGYSLVIVGHSLGK